MDPHYINFKPAVLFRQDSFWHKIKLLPALRRLSPRIHLPRQRPLELRFTELEHFFSTYNSCQSKLCESHTVPYYCLFSMIYIRSIFPATLHQIPNDMTNVMRRKKLHIRLVIPLLMKGDFRSSTQLIHIHQMTKWKIFPYLEGRR